MRPKNTSRVRKGLMQMLARVGSPIGADEEKAAAYIRGIGNMKKLRPNNPSGPPPKRRKSK